MSSGTLSRPAKNAPVTTVCWQLTQIYRLAIKSERQRQKGPRTKDEGRRTALTLMWPWVIPLDRRTGWVLSATNENHRKLITITRGVVAVEHQIPKTRNPIRDSPSIRTFYIGPIAGIWFNAPVGGVFIALYFKHFKCRELCPSHWRE